MIVSIAKAPFSGVVGRFVLWETELYDSTPMTPTEHGWNSHRPKYDRILGLSSYSTATVRHQHSHQGGILCDPVLLFVCFFVMVCENFGVSVVMSASVTVVTVDAEGAGCEPEIVENSGPRQIHRSLGISRRFSFPLVVKRY